MHVTIATLAVALMTTMFGCHRDYYRRQADLVARQLIQEKSLDPRWDSHDGSIEVDPQSRMFDPFCADHPPIPPDDAESHKLMHCVDGKPGYECWHANGNANSVENPNWKSYLPVNEQGQVVLSLARAYELALLNSTQLQAQHETLYLSALDVSLERFGFDTQLFAGFNGFLTTQGRLRNGDGLSRTNLQGQLGSNGQGIQWQRLGISGTNLVVGLANTILFNVAGNNTQTSSSLIDFTLIQPLLRGAGRERIMESLTQSERTLLSNVRQLERFRRGFYLQIATGRNPGAGPSRGGFGLGLPGGGNSNVGGFVGLLEQRQQIRNQQFNVRQLEAVLDQFKEYSEAGLVNAVQLKLFETSFYREQRVLLDAKTQYQTSLDDFKFLVGLPPDLDVIIDDPYLDRFELISDEINNRLIQIGDLRTEAGQAISLIQQATENYQDPGFVWPEDLDQRLSKLLPSVNAAQQIIDDIREQDFVQLEKDLANLGGKREPRSEYLKSLSDDVAAGKIISSIDRELFEVKTIPESEKLGQLLKSAVGEEIGAIEPDSGPSIQRRLVQLETELAKAKSRIDGFAETRQTLRGKALYDYLDLELQQAIPSQLAELNNIMLDLSLLQAQARSNSIEIINTDISSEHAIRIARCLRRDWMNARAALVDQYRNIEFVADQLEATVDLVFQGDLGNNSDNPLDLRYETGQLRAGFRFDAPIVRIAERNAYREALINYQQARRSFYRFEDAIKGDLRSLVRDLGRNRVRFELDRRSVQVQIENVEINRLELDRPVDSANNQIGTSTARNLTDAIVGLNDAQNSYLRTWVEYEVLRRNLDFDLGTMQLDESGFWVDPGKIDGSIGVRALALLGVEPDCQFCDDIDISTVELPAFEETTIPQDPPKSAEDEIQADPPARVRKQEAAESMAPLDSLVELEGPPVIRAEEIVPAEFGISAE
jgi:hypothetical protein